MKLKIYQLSVYNLSGGQCSAVVIAEAADTKDARELFKAYGEFEGSRVEVLGVAGPVETPRVVLMTVIPVP